mgnify:CR=1 FL=1
MRILKAFVLSIFVSGGSFVAGAVVLAIVNIYLSGHGIDWPNQDYETGMTGMSPLSTVLAIFVITVFTGVFGGVYWVLGRSNSSDTGDRLSPKD